ncbi:MAG: ABC transporter permease, partial [Planctomycetota bacterium]
FAVVVAQGQRDGKFRLVGTTPEFFNTLKHGPLVDQPFTFAEGENFKLHDSEIGFFGAVVGARVAAEKNIGVGDIIHPNHGDPEGKGHDRGFTIVGVLDPTGTPNDRAAFVNLEGFYLLNDHSKPLPPGVEDAPAQLDSLDATLASKEGREPLVPLTIRQREVTSILVRPKDMGSGVLLENRVQESLKAQAAAPIGEINKLLQFIRPLLTVLLVITIITAVVAANGILVSIYNSMNERRRDIAIMRALGARRDTVTAIILIESVIIAIIGGVAGWFLAHVGIWLAGGIIEQNTGVQVSLLTISRLELWAGVLVLGLAVLAGSVPAAMAYRTDVTKNLSA